MELIEKSFVCGMDTLNECIENGYTFVLKTKKGNNLFIRTREIDDKWYYAYNNEITIKHIKQCILNDKGILSYIGISEKEFLTEIENYSIDTIVYYTNCISNYNGELISELYEITEIDIYKQLEMLIEGF